MFSDGLAPRKVTLRWGLGTYVCKDPFQAPCTFFFTRSENDVVDMKKCNCGTEIKIEGELGSSSRTPIVGTRTIPIVYRRFSTQFRCIKHICREEIRTNYAQP